MGKKKGIRGLCSQANIRQKRMLNMNNQHLRISTFLLGEEQTAWAHAGARAAARHCGGCAVEALSVSPGYASPCRSNGRATTAALLSPPVILQADWRALSRRAIRQEVRKIT